MMNNHIFDQFSIELLFLLTFAFMVLMLEFGFRFGHRTHAKLVKAQTAQVNRIPVIIWLTLYFTAVMSMIVVGYQAGLTEKRSPVATISLALAFSAVMMLIMDLDRPLQSLFEFDVTVMKQLAVFMRKGL
jgi:hypothetical protein